MIDHNRYIKIVRWAERRYRQANGELVMSYGNVPSIYCRIEKLAWDRYCAGLQCDRAA